MFVLILYIKIGLFLIQYIHLLLQEGIQLLHREGVSVEETADHLRSGQTFKNVQEPDSSEIINIDENDDALEEEQEEAEAVPLKDDGEAEEEAAPNDKAEAQMEPIVVVSGSDAVSLFNSK